MRCGQKRYIVLLGCAVKEKGYSSLSQSSHFRGLECGNNGVPSGPSVDGDCSHEIKRRLLHGRKAMRNLDRVLKSRDVTLPTKVCLVKAVVFFPSKKPQWFLVMYGREA